MCLRFCLLVVGIARWYTAWWTELGTTSTYCYLNNINVPRCDFSYVDRCRWESLQGEHQEVCVTCRAIISCWSSFYEKRDMLEVMVGRHGV
jgi:hypothetical protein